MRTLSYSKTMAFAGDTFWENPVNVETANVGALFQREMGGWVPGISRPAKNPQMLGENLVKMQEIDENPRMSG